LRAVRRALLVIAALLLLGAPAASAAKRRPAKCNGEARLCDRRFDRVVIPATHNSMSAASLGWTIPNQTRSIPRQLADGVRGFLIDTHYASRRADGKVYTEPNEQKTPTSGLYLCHEFCHIGATPLVTGLRWFAKYLKAHPRNVIVIVQEDHISPQDYASAVRKAGLERYVYRGKAGRPWPTLRTMIRRHHQVVMLAEQKAAGVSWEHRAYAGIVQETPYTFKQPALLTKSADWNHSCRANRGGKTASLFLMNHWSPSTPGNPPDLALARKVNATKVLVGRATACHKRRGHWPTLVAVDQYTEGGLLAAVRRLNTLIAR
jgi:hypothetical protein